MGLTQSRYQKLFAKNKTIKLRTLLLGLDCAGKTTLLNLIKLDQIETEVPTIGFNVETVHYQGHDIISWDLDSAYIRPLWRYYYHTSTAIVYVVDACDIDRLERASYQLTRLLDDTGVDCAGPSARPYPMPPPHQNSRETVLANLPLLVLVNKLDGDIRATEVEQKRGHHVTATDILTQFPYLRDRPAPTRIFACSAKEDTGVYEGLKWLMNICETYNPIDLDNTGAWEEAETERLYKEMTTECASHLLDLPYVLLDLCVSYLDLRPARVVELSSYRCS